MEQVNETNTHTLTTIHTTNDDEAGCKQKVSKRKSTPYTSKIKINFPFPHMPITPHFARFPKATATNSHTYKILYSQGKGKKCSNISSTRVKIHVVSVLRRYH